MSFSEELRLLITGKNEAKPALDEVRQQTQAAGSSLGDAAKAGAAFGVGMEVATKAVEKVAGAVIETVRAIGELAAEAEKIQQKAAITGFSTDAVQSFKRIAETADTSSETVFRAVSKMQKAAVEGKRGFTELGLGAQEFLALAPEQQFEAVARRIMAIPDPAERAAAAMALFGRSGAELLPILAAIAKGGADVVALSDDQVQALAGLDDALDKTSGYWRDLKTQLLATVGSSPEARQGLSDMAEMVGWLATQIKDARGPLSDYVTLLTRMAGLSGSNSIGGAFRLGSILTEKGPTPTNGSISTQPKPLTYDPMAAWAEMDAKSGTIAQQKAAVAEELRAQKSVETARRKEERIAEAEKRRIDASIRAGMELGDAESAMYQQLADEAEQAEARKSAIHVAAVRDQMEVDRWLEQQRRQAEQEELRRQEELYRSALNLVGAVREFGDVIGGSFGKVISIGAGAVQTFMQMSKELENLSGKAATYAKISMGIGAVTSAYAGGSVLGGAATGAAAGMAIGGPIGGVVGGAVGAIAGLFGKGKKEKEEAAKVDEQRKAFIEAAGGIRALRAEADAAGVSLTRMLNAKTAKDYEAAIKDVQKALQLHDQAVEDTRKAIEKYGITIDQLGPKWRQQELDKQAAELLKEYQLLATAGVSQGVLIEKMGANLNEYVNTAVRAGVEIPKAMQPTIQAMYEQGKLLHEDGTAYTEAEFNALKYGQTTSEAFQSMIDLLAALVKAVGGDLPAAFRTAGDEAEKQGARMRNSIPDGARGGGGYGGDYGGGSTEGVPEMRRGGVILPFVPRAANGIVTARPGGSPVIVGEGGKAELVAPVAALADRIGAAAAAAAGAGGQTVHVHVQLGTQELATAIVRLNRSGWLPVAASSVRS